MLAALWQVDALRQSYDRLASNLATELGRYRVLLVTPALIPKAARNVDVPVLRAARRTRPRPRVAPLVTPNPRLLRRLDPQLQEFAADNPEIEDIFTREIVRDVDTKVLDVRKLFEEGALQIGFDTDDAGRPLRSRVEVSSGVPSIDHLALQIVGLLERYQLAWVFRGFSHVALKIRTGQDMEIRLTCTPTRQESQEDIVKRIRGTLMLVRIAAAQSDAAFLLQDIEISSEVGKITLSRTLSKEPLASFLMRYWQTETPQ